MRKRLTYANVISTICLFVVLGGGAYAAGAIHLPKNSVGNKQLKKNAVTSDKVKDGSLTGADINAATIGTVPSAGSAETAKNASSLGGQSAAQITAAAIAASKVHCPAGTKIAAGACLEDSTRAATSLFSALIDCGDDNRRVPSQGELLAYGRTYGISTAEWAEPEYTDSGAFKGVIVSANSTSASLSFVESSGSHVYRCAVAATN